jgi:ATP-dependent protease ClpP protease subunit
MAAMSGKSIVVQVPEQATRLHALLEGQQPRPWYEIRNATDSDHADIYIYDEIGYWGVTANDFVRDLRDLNGSELRVHINSPGGDVWAGISILNALRAHDARIVVTVDGVAASAASFIAMAGDEVVMGRNSEMMIHDARGVCFGNASDMHELADRMDKVSDNIASIYAERAGGTVATWRSAMQAETWYSADEAVQEGLADRVEDVKAAAKAHFDLSAFKHAGRAKAPAPIMHRPAASAVGAPEHEENTVSDLASIAKKLGLAEDADAATVENALDEALAERMDPPADKTSEPAPAAPAAAPAANALPDGTSLVDTAALETLKAQAAAGAAAREQQETDRRAALVEAAVNDGRIAVAQRKSWTDKLAAEGESGEQVLASLSKGLVPLNEVGHGEGAETADDDALFAEMQNLGLQV